MPAPSRPATVASNGGYASGAQGLGAYRPGTIAPTYSQSSDVTGSVRAPAPPQPKPSGAWTWDGGSPVTVGYGESAEAIARRHGVPVAALLETNGISNASAIKPGQRLVIPRYVSSSPAPHVQAPAAQAPAPMPASVATDVHIVQPGESLTGIARKRGVAVAVLARANNIQPYAKVAAGDRLTIPGGHPVAPRQVQAQAQIQPQPQFQAPAPQIAQPRTVSVDKVGSVRCRMRASRRKKLKRPRTPSPRPNPLAPCRHSAGRSKAASLPASVRKPAARRTTASISRCRRARRSRPPTTASSLTPVMNSKATAI
ncbi:MAG: LysM peptidoglycan-binding domain-containing protein [Pseudolabrys sp.]